jgi:hypothetical protein
VADQRITQLNELPKAGVAATDVLPIADVSASETKKVTAKNLVDAGLDLVDAGSIDLDKLDQSSTTKLGTAALADEAVTYAKIQNVSATDKLLGRSTADAGVVEEIDCTAAGRALLDDADADAQRTTLGLGTIATQDADAIAITGGTITGGTITGITDLEVADGGTGASTADNARQNLGVEIGVDVQAYDAGLASIADLATSTDQTIYTTASDTYAVTSLTAAGRALLDDADAAAQRTTLGLGDVATADQVSTAQIQDAAVTAAKLANESVVDLVTTLPATGTYIGQFALITTNNKLYSWTGAAWTEIKAAGSVNDIISDNTGIVNTAVSIASGDATIGTSLDDTVNAAEFLAGPTSGGGAVTYRTIVGADLPTPTTTTKGAVVVNGNGLTLSGDTIAISNTVSAETANYHIVQYNANGLVTSGRLLNAGDVPVATASSLGVVQPGTGLGVDGAGSLGHANSVAAGTGTKITFDSEGHVTSTAPLDSTDIPELDASKITTGTFGSAFLAENSVTASQLADYGIAQVSETAPTPEFAGQWWINPSDRSAYIWVGTVSPAPNGYWLLVGYGSPTQLNLRFGGTYDATANTVVTLNEYGVEAGLVIGQPLGTPNSQNNGVYLAVTTAGTGTTPAPVASLAVGDWVLSQGTGSNWTKVAVVSGASGTFNDYDILCDGTYFTPDMSAVADVRDALELLWGRVQIASTVTRGIVLESTEVLVDNSTGEMTIGVVDDGTY